MEFAVSWETDIKLIITPILLINEIVTNASKEKVQRPRELIIRENGGREAFLKKKEFKQPHRGWVKRL